MRDLIQDAPLIERDRKDKEKAPSSQWGSNSGPRNSKSDILPLELPPWPTTSSVIETKPCLGG